MSNGNERSPENRMQDLDENLWGSIWSKVGELKDDRKRRIATSLAESQSLEEMIEKVDHIERGTWVDNAMLAGASLVGVVLGYKTQKYIDIRAGSVPVTGMLGLAGVIPGLVMKRKLTARNVVGLGGATFIVGAGLYTNEHPIPKDDL